MDDIEQCPGCEAGMTAICECCGGLMEFEKYDFAGLPVEVSSHDCWKSMKEVAELERLYEKEGE